jgi:(p)ppGpp synthase/HD superfamily hydrolase
MLNKAIEIATKAHAGQVDKSGNPCILHPLRVMLACESEIERIYAILHDVIEDTPITLGGIKGTSY